MFFLKYPLHNYKHLFDNLTKFLALNKVIIISKNIENF